MKSSLGPWRLLPSMIPSGSARAMTRYRPMTPRKTRMSRSSRLGSGRTRAAATSPGRAAAASAMDRAPGVDPDPLPRQEDGHGALLRDPETTDEIDRKIGAKKHVLQAI